MKKYYNNTKDTKQQKIKEELDYNVYIFDMNKILTYNYFIYIM